jgi:hypothetical protein
MAVESSVEIEEDCVFDHFQPFTTLSRSIYARAERSIRRYLVMIITGRAYLP